MANIPNQKIKLLKLYEILKQETDEEHPLTTNQLCDRLINIGISCDRRTLYKDIKILKDNGYDVLSYRKDHDKVYCVADRSFDVAELRILIDAVQAATFIPESKTTQFISKIADLGGSNRADILMRNSARFGKHKHENASILYSVNDIQDAIAKKKRIEFIYFDYDENHNKVYRGDKKIYSMDPLALIFNNDNYYLVAYNPNHANTNNYRVDKMENIVITDTEICEEAKIEGSEEKLKSKVETEIKMYSAEIKKVTLVFDSKVISNIFDKFGPGIKMLKLTDTLLAAEVNVQTSPTFYGWLSEFGGKITVSSPQDVVNDYKEHLEKCMTELKNYF